MQISLSAAPYELFVAPNGNDAWSGRLAETKAGGTDGPFATLPAALKAARQTRAKGQAADGITIWIPALAPKKQFPIRSYQFFCFIMP